LHKMQWWEGKISHGERGIIIILLLHVHHDGFNSR
jgi:hypothetical protein